MSVLDHSSIQVESLRGRWVLINYWAIWCEPCRAEVPVLNTLHEGSDLLVFGVNYDQEQGEVLRDQVNAMDMRFPQLLEDPAGLFAFSRPASLPTSVLVNPAGNISAVHKGEISLSQIEKMMSVER